jgi:hypothetical protein
MTTIRSEREGFRLVVGDVDRGEPEAGVQALDLRSHLEPELRVQIAQRFIEEQDPWLDHQGAGDGHPLLLAARELGGIAPGEALELDERQHAGHPGGNLVARHPAHAQPEGDVLEDGEMRKERVVLEHHAEAATLRHERIDAPLVEPDLARARREQPREEIQRGGLATARWAEKSDELATPHLEGEVVEDVLRPEVLAQAKAQLPDHVRLD